MAVWKVRERIYSDLIDQLLYNRGVDLEKEKELFLNPDFAKGLFDPYRMKGIKDAVTRIKKAKGSNEVVGIFSDYDADGIPGAALLFRALNKIGLKAKVYIPNRNAGYGLSKEGIDYLIKENCSLIITCDLGIRNFAEAKYCKGKVDLIITDHHTPDEKLPDPDILINPKIKGDKYPFKELAGCGVAYKLTQALAKEFSEIDEQFLKWNLDLVAISTISDVVPLISENRVLARYGLIVLSKTKNIGLKALYEIGKIDPKNINAYVAGFQIAPRINAPGRVDHASKSFELLITEDKEEAKGLAQWLEEKNFERQESMDRVEKEALKIIEKENLDQNQIIVAAGNWSKGVIGPTSSRLVEKLSRPVILFSEEKDSFCGSARSIEGVNILELLQANESFLKKYGGHKGAAGLTVLNEKFSLFKKALLEYANRIINPSVLVKKIKAETEISPKEINLEVAELIDQLEPFGMGNPKPVFYLPKVNISDIRKIGKDEKHLSFSLEKDGLVAKCVYFNFPPEQKIEKGEYDLMLNLRKEIWREKEYLKLFIVDMRKSDEKD